MGILSQPLFIMCIYYGKFRVINEFIQLNNNNNNNRANAQEFWINGSQEI